MTLESQDNKTADCKGCNYEAEYSKAWQWHTCGKAVGSTMERTATDDMVEGIIDEFTLEIKSFQPDDGADRGALDIEKSEMETWLRSKFNEVISRTREEKPDTVEVGHASNNMKRTGYSNHLSNPTDANYQGSKTVSLAKIRKEGAAAMKEAILKALIDNEDSDIYRVKEIRDIITSLEL